MWGVTQTRLQFVLGEAVVGGAALAHEARRVAEGGGAVVTRLHEVHGAVGSPPEQLHLLRLQVVVVLLSQLLRVFDVPILAERRVERLAGERRRGRAHHEILAAR